MAQAYQVRSQSAAPQTQLTEPGMCMAIDLIRRNKCHNFIIVEKSSSIGGTWHDNRYPGCCCDVWSLLYSYSFEQNPDWTREYPGQEEILVSVREAEGAGRD